MHSIEREYPKSQRFVGYLSANHLSPLGPEGRFQHKLRLFSRLFPQAPVTELEMACFGILSCLMQTDGSLLEGQEKEEYVTGMFNRIAKPYDKLNGLISLGRDAKWRQLALDWAGVKAGEHVADLGTGTGDFFLEIRRRVGPDGRAVGIDIAENMLALAQEKANEEFNEDCDLRLGSAAKTGLPDSSLDVVTMGWVLRNVADRQAVYQEVQRVLKPGGRFLCVDMSKPSFAPLRWASQSYLALAMPILIKVAGGDREAYDYLNRSTQRFPNRTELEREWQGANFSQVKSRSFMMGSIAAHLATSP